MYGKGAGTASEGPPTQGSVGCAAQEPEDGFQAEAAGLQKAHLAGLAGRVNRQRAELLLPYGARRREFYFAQFGGNLCDFAFGNALLAQFLHDPSAAEARPSGAGHGFGVARVRQKTLLDEIIEQGLQVFRAFRVGGELFLQFGTAVFAPGEEAQGAIFE